MAYNIGTSPVTSLMVWVYQLLSLLIPDSNRRFIYSLEAIMNVGQFANLFVIWGFTEDFIINSYLAVQHFTGLVGGRFQVLKIVLMLFLSQIRALTISSNRTRFQRYIRKIDKTYFELLKNTDPVIREIIAKYTKQTRTLTKFNFFMGILISVFFCCYPFSTATRTLPYSVWIPGVDVLKSPVYEIIFSIEVSVNFGNPLNTSL